MISNQRDDFNKCNYFLKLYVLRSLQIPSVMSRISGRYPVRQWIWTVPTVKQPNRWLWRTSNHRRRILSIWLEKVHFVRTFFNIRERTICTYSCSCSHFFVRTFANEWKPYSQPYLLWNQWYIKHTRKESDDKNTMSVK